MASTRKRHLPCDICHEVFDNKWGLTQHRRRQHDTLPNRECPICHKTFSTEDACLNHMHLHTGEKPHKCTLCDKSYLVAGALENHMRTHTGERPYQCDKCDKRFFSNGDLKSHSISTHSKERPFVCMVCGNSFKQKKGLLSHLRLVHTDSRHHQCHECGKRFKTKSNLTIHQTCHGGEKPHECHWCGKMFKNSTQLNRHIKETHEGEKPHVCHICGKASARPWNLKKHMRIHPEYTEPFKAQQTGPVLSATSTVEDLKKHMRTVSIISMKPVKVKSEIVEKTDTRQVHTSAGEASTVEDFKKHVKIMCEIMEPERVECAPEVKEACTNNSDKHIGMQAESGLSCVHKAPQNAPLLSGAGSADSTGKHTGICAENTEPMLEPLSQQSDFSIFNLQDDTIESSALQHHETSDQSDYNTQNNVNTLESSTVSNSTRSLKISLLDERPSESLSLDPETVVNVRMDMEESMKYKQDIGLGIMLDAEPSDSFPEDMEHNATSDDVRESDLSNLELASQTDACFGDIMSAIDDNVSVGQKKDEISKSCDEKVFVPSNIESVSVDTEAAVETVVKHEIKLEPETVTLDTCGTTARTNVGEDSLDEQLHTEEASVHRRRSGRLRKVQFNYANLFPSKKHSKVKKDAISSIGKTIFSCDDCHQQFIGFRRLQRHRKAEHPPQCKVCHRSFKIASSLKKHMLVHQDEKPHKCSLCDKSYVSALGLNMHMRTHTGEKPYQCNVCDKTFPTKQQKNRHMDTHIPKVSKHKYKCRICPATFKRKPGLTRHGALHNPKRAFACHVCGLRYSTQPILNLHLVTHQERKHACQQCSRRFLHPGQLINHINFVHKRLRPYVCRICGLRGIRPCYIREHINKRHAHMIERSADDLILQQHRCSQCPHISPSVSELKRHLKLSHTTYKCDVCCVMCTSREDLIQHQKDHDFKDACGVCGERFSDATKLQYHMFKHTPGPPYRCEICKRAFKSRVYLRSHHTLRHNESLQQCGVCMRRFHNLERHVQQVHGGNQPHMCQTCGKVYRSRSSLTHHMVTHGERRYKCDLCDKAFFYPSDLTTHRKLHSEERPYPCVVCGKAFKCASNLRGHIELVHTDKRNHQCDICGWTSKNKSHLNYHKLRHTGERPWACDLCDKRFYTSGDRNHHVKDTHTREKPHVCHICGKRSARAYNLRKHMRIHAIDLDDRKDLTPVPNMY